MKKTILITGISLIILLVVIIGCDGTSGNVNLDKAGYGRTSLPNGITLLVNHDETTSLTAARILIGGGVLTEDEDNNGITNLMTRMLLKGNDKMSASEINERLDFLGAHVTVNCFRDYSAISFSCLTENFDAVLDIISQSVLTPTFPDEELAKLKREVEGDIKASDDSQSEASSKLFWRTIYGGRGYGLPTLGTLESIANIGIEDIRAHYRNYVGGDNVIFSIATDLPADQAVAGVGGLLGKLKKQAMEIPEPDLVHQMEKTGFISYDRNQSFIYAGVAMDYLTAEEVPYLILLNQTMGTGVGSRLWFLRQKEKLAYSVYSQFGLDKYDAIFRAAIGTDTAKVKMALGSLDREWQKMVQEGLTADELADAKVNMKNDMFYWIDTKSVRANNMAYLEYIGYGYKFVLDLIDMADRVTLEQINDFIGTHFSRDEKYVSIVGKK